MYTSGWPKNQNKCWNRTGSPPVCASKKAVPKFLSVKSIVIAPAKTGRDSKSKNAVTRIDHENNGILCKVIPGVLPFAPGGPSTKIETSNKIRATGNSQKEILFILGKAISGAPIMIGTNQLPNPPIIAGMTIKKIIIRPWPVTKTLYKW